VVLVVSLSGCAFVDEVFRAGVGMSVLAILLAVTLVAGITLLIQSR
jgi:hypothetical protein